MVLARIGEPSDEAWLLNHTEQHKQNWVAMGVAHQRYVIAQIDGQAVGYLRFSLLWGHIPFMEEVWVEPDSRGEGAGRTMVGFWEDWMKADGALTLVTSAEEHAALAQKWHQANGYRPAGRLGLGLAQADDELYFIKDLH
ncbi:MAG: GNAT family N-acetyltransferase [Planctomycetota bacterium]